MVSKKRDCYGSSDLIINDLPDALIGHILSFLTTKEAASTSILSGKWRYLFAFSPNLDFDDSIYLIPREAKKVPIVVDNTIVMVDENKNNISTSFMDFVDRVLALQGNSFLHKFSLKIEDNDDPVDPNRIFGWVRNVLQRGVSDLSLDMGLESEVMIPAKIFLSKTLVRLKLIFGYSRIMDVGNVDLPKLKTLCIETVDFENDGIGFTKFLSGCPMLEDLVLEGIHWSAWDFVSVSVTTLKRLTFFWGGRDENPKSVSFDTPNLIYLEYTDTIAEKYLKVNFGSLVEANIDLRMSHGQREERSNLVGNATNFILGICNVKILSLSADTLELLTYCCKSIPLFNNLTHLTIESHWTIGWQSLPGLLKNSPKLETLVLQGLTHKATDGCGDVCLCNGYEEIPSCLLSSPVKVLKIMEYGVLFHEEIEKQTKRVKHFLETMPNLEELILYYETTLYEEHEMIELLRQVLRRPKVVASSKCNLKVISENLCVSSTLLFLKK